MIRECVSDNPSPEIGGLSGRVALVFGAPARYVLRTRRRRGVWSGRYHDIPTPDRALAACASPTLAEASRLIWRLAAGDGADAVGVKQRSAFPARPDKEVRARSSARVTAAPASRMQDGSRTVGRQGDAEVGETHVYIPRAAPRPALLFAADRTSQQWRTTALRFARRTASAPGRARQKPASPPELRSTYLYAPASAAARLEVSTPAGRSGSAARSRSTNRAPQRASDISAGISSATTGSPTRDAQGCLSISKSGPVAHRRWRATCR